MASIVFDTIPLTLYLVGSYDPNYIAKFKRLRSYKYNADDFGILNAFLSNASSAIVTPGVLAEASNYLENDSHFADILKANLIVIDGLKEKYISIKDIIAEEEVYKFGVADSSLIIAARDTNSIILTRDYPLAGLCKKLGIQYRHLDDHILEPGRAMLGLY